MANTFPDEADVVTCTWKTSCIYCWKEN